MTPTGSLRFLPRRRTWFNKSTSASIITSARGSKLASPNPKARIYGQHSDESGNQGSAEECKNPLRQLIGSLLGRTSPITVLVPGCASGSATQGIIRGHGEGLRTRMRWLFRPPNRLYCSRQRISRCETTFPDNHSGKRDCGPTKAAEGFDAETV